MKYKNKNKFINIKILILYLDFNFKQFYIFIQTSSYPIIVQQNNKYYLTMNSP